jgi:2-methylcitrate dehydratase PrpD
MADVGESDEGEFPSRRAYHDKRGIEISKELASFVAGTSFDDLPDAVVERMKKSILDVISVGIYGSGFKPAQLPLNYVRAHPGREDASIFCGGGMASAFDAALVNGTTVHLTEFAEGFSRASVHPGNSIVPGVLALSEREGRSGRDLLAGVSVAEEFNVRQGMATGTPLNLNQGIHPPAMLGAIASAVGCAKAMDLDLYATSHVMGIAACHAPTPLMSATYDGVTEKDLQQGYNTALGVYVVDIQAAGFEGPVNWVGPWYHAIPREYDLEPLVFELGTRWYNASGGIRIKTRPVMGMCQPTTFALYDLLLEQEVPVDQIDDIYVESSKRIYYSQIYEPDTLVAGRASIPFLVSAALINQKEFTDDYYCVDFLREARAEELLRDPAVRALQRKVRLGVDPEFDFNLEHAKPSDDTSHYIKFEARVTITLKDGSKVVAYKDVFAAGTGNMSRDDVAGKARACARGQLEPEVIDEIIDMVWNLEQLKDAGDLARRVGSSVAKR